jgi:hypothetical protein
MPCLITACASDAKQSALTTCSTTLGSCICSTVKPSTDSVFDPRIDLRAINPAKSELKLRCLTSSSVSGSVTSNSAIFHLEQEAVLRGSIAED